MNKPGGPPWRAASFEEEALFTPAEFAGAVTSAAAQLDAARRALQALACPAITTLEIRLDELDGHRIEALLAGVPTGYRKDEREDDHVYLIQAAAPGSGLAGELAAQLAEARKLGADYSRLNPGNLPTDTLYVGRSKTPRARLRQHLGAEGRGVFSLHLQRWAGGSRAAIRISLMRFHRLDDLLVQAVEDGLWASLRPAFGRKGER
ncbi:hypothetical protein GPA19_13020 [Azoarcus indigens]|uniref:GIY-YIG catalytic domain-containing protein n=1 Tax=Azoarcus indigens TaxID=29545 RepID=A0A4R6DTV2_9RHOO|nr:hypothetical protein [Azoarcus indigens]NMG65867.1 hypothetical protein [Azoarcus indigens]TDN47718.1 hypothetical protein C7389_11827 [Azoarcus indigens]